MIVGKANKMLGFLQKKKLTAQVVGSKALLRLFCSLVRSHFCQCLLSVMGPSVSHEQFITCGKESFTFYVKKVTLIKL